VTDLTKEKAKTKASTWLFLVIIIMWVLSLAVCNRCDTTPQKAKSKTPNWQGSATYACEDFVKPKLVSPGSAKFAGIMDGILAKYMRKDAKGYHHFILNSWVDSKNKYGVPLRQNFSCLVKTKDGKNWRLENLSF